MCELNPKRKAIYRLEFWTSHELTQEQFIMQVVPRLLMLEEVFKKEGKVRVHVHEVDVADLREGAEDE